MADNDAEIAKLATGLNEDAKAARKKTSKSREDALQASKEHLSGSVISEADDDLAGAVNNLGTAINQDAASGTAGVDLSEAAHNTAIERMEAMASDSVLNSKALVFDVRDFLIDQIKSRPKPWSATSNAEQRDVAAACEHAGRELVRKMVEAIAAGGESAPVRLLLTKIAIGDDVVVTAKVKAFSEEEAERDVSVLHKARGKHVLLTVASVDDYSGEAREAETDPDEPGLGFEAGSDENDD